MPPQALELDHFVEQHKPMSPQKLELQRSKLRSSRSRSDPRQELELGQVCKLRPTPPRALKQDQEESRFISPSPPECLLEVDLDGPRPRRRGRGKGKQRRRKGMCLEHIDLGGAPAAADWTLQTPEGCVTVPPLDELLAMSTNALSTVIGFELIKEGVGAIKWDRPLDLVGLDLSSIEISEDEISFQAAELDRVDGPLCITLEHVSPMPDCSRLESSMHYGRMQECVDDYGGILESYEPRTGQLQIRMNTVIPSYSFAIVGTPHRKQKSQQLRATFPMVNCPSVSIWGDRRSKGRRPQQASMALEDSSYSNVWSVGKPRKISQGRRRLTEDYFLPTEVELDDP